MRVPDGRLNRNPGIRSAADSPSGTMAIRFRGRARELGDPGLHPRESPIRSESGRMYADANGSHSIPEFLADKMVETKIWNRRTTLIFQSLMRMVPAKVGIQRLS